jgi:hypothetical protein
MHISTKYVFTDAKAENFGKLKSCKEPKKNKTVPRYGAHSVEK